MVGSHTAQAKGGTIRREASSQTVWRKRSSWPELADRAISANVKVFGCRPFTDTYRRAETGPAFENLQGRKPRVGRAPTRCRELWGFERRRRLLASGRSDHQRRFGRIERSQEVFSVGHGMIFLAAALLGRGGWRMFRRAPAARSNDPRQKRAELRHGG